MATATALSEKQLAEILAEFIVETRYEDLAKENIAKVKEYIVDIVGCMIGASREPQTKALLEVMAEMQGAPESTRFSPTASRRRR